MRQLVGKLNKFVILHINSHFTCGKSKFHRKKVNCKRIIIRVVKNFQSRFTFFIMIQISMRCSVFAKKEKFIEKTLAKQKCELFNVNLWHKSDMVKSAYRDLLNWNFFATSLLYIYIKLLKRAPKFSKMWKYRRLKETGASYTQKVVSTDNDEIFGKNQTNQEKLEKKKIWRQCYRTFWPF